MTDRPGLPYPPRGLCREDAALYIGVGTTTFDDLVATGRMPKPMLQENRIRWTRLDLDAAFTRLGNEGTIYVIQAFPETPVKIGFTRHDDVSKRIADLQAGNPHRLRVLAATCGTMDQERAVHAVLATDRLTGEWFAWTERTARLVDLMAEGIQIVLTAFKESTP